MENHAPRSADRNPLRAEHQARFERDGYFLLEGVLDQSTVEIVRETVRSLAREEDEAKAAHFYDGSRQKQRIWNLLNKAAIFREIIQQRTILDAMEWIFDRDTPHFKYFLSSFQANILYPGASAQKLHIDTPVPDPLPPWVIKANTIWPLGDFGAANGATEVLPGSHRFGRRPSGADLQRTDVIPIIAPAGSVLVTHGALWHRAGGNRADRERIALLGSFAASFAREIANEEDYSRVLSPEHLENGSETLRQIMGYGHGVRPGATHPSKLR